ncbi:MAG: hypothetical protein ACLFRI_00035 [Candidatus Izemoplasmataceae bacterium]
MTNLFGIRKEKGFDYEINGDHFKVKQIPNELEKKMNETSNWMASVKQQAKLPTGLNFLKTFSFVIFLVILFSLYRSESSLEVIFKEIPIVFYIAFAFLLLSISLWFYERQKRKKVLNKENMDLMKAKIDTVLNEAKAYLDIPEDAIEIDVFTYTYKLNERSDEINNTNKMFTYMNQPLKFYIKNDMLYFGDHFNLYAIPTTSFQSITKIDEKVSVYGWHKENSFKQEPYKAFNIKSNQFGVLTMRPYYQVKILDEGKAYNFFIPPYEVHALSQLLKIDIH